MSESQTLGAGAPNGDRAALVTEDRIREELSRVLASHEFRSSRRSQDFLRYVIENTLNGRADLLKERTIGMEVFGRPASYDPSDDATVRVKAGEVRKRLGLYYSTEGVHDPVRIELPAGTYVPEFRAITIEIPAPAKTAPPRTIPLVTGRRMRLAAAVVVAGGALLWLTTRLSVTPLDQF